MRNIFSTHKRLIRLIGFLIILSIVAVYIGLPTVMALTVIAPETPADGVPPEGFSTIMLTTPGNVRLAAWYAEPQNGAVIILVHGAGSGRESVRGYATMLHEGGFGVLALNLRGYGDSDGRINRLGWHGTQDIGTAIAYLNRRDGVDMIGGLGISLGGEVLLGATSQYPVIRAVVADGATYRAVNEYTALPANRPLYRNFTQRVFSFMVSVLSGDVQPKPPLLESIQESPNTSFLFIAAGNDDTEVAYNQYFHETLPDNSSLWIIPDVGHTGGFTHTPDEYERRVIDFFNQVLLTP
jgi:uncharacterized protein